MPTALRMSVVPPARFADVQREAYRANLEDPLFWEAYPEVRRVTSLFGARSISLEIESAEPAGANVAIRWEQTPETQNARPSIARRRALTGVPGRFMQLQQVPRKEPVRSSTR